jgi:hypothetical protein
MMALRRPNKENNARNVAESLPMKIDRGRYMDGAKSILEKDTVRHDRGLCGRSFMTKQDAGVHGIDDLCGRNNGRGSVHVALTYNDAHEWSVKPSGCERDIVPYIGEREFRRDM